jgi:multisubunit Na+/H+ antiporter MnhC subunit
MQYMELIIALVAGLVVAGAGVFLLMRHQLMKVRAQLSTTQQALTNEQ